MTASRVHSRVLDVPTTLALDLSGVTLIEASAGTGKTYAISNLYLRHVLAGFGVRRILVVTFTNAATEELRGRIRRRLREAQAWLEQGGGEGEDEFLQALCESFAVQSQEKREEALLLLRLALRSMEEASIFTIHGFCLRALMDHAFSSGQAFRLDLIRDDELLWQEALKDWWRRHVYELSPESLALFVSVFPTLKAFLEAQAILRQASEKQVIPTPEPYLDAVFDRWQSLQPALASLAKQWIREHETLHEILLTSKALSRSKDSGYRLVELQLSLAELDRYFASDEWAELPIAFELLSVRTLSERSTEKKRGTDENLEHPFFHACESVLSQWQSLQNRLRVSALQLATRAAREQMDIQKRLTQTLSYQDQLSRLHEALHGPSGPALTQQLRAAFPVAMIDEFQDTDTLQYEIFRRLYVPEEKEAQALSLTMIGDPKQAIYSFRGGDIFAYARARKDAGERRLTLDTNWRSIPALVHAVNRMFETRANPFVYGDIIDFEPVQAARKKEHKALIRGGEEEPALRFWDFGSNDEGRQFTSGVLNARLSEAVADAIIRLLEEGKKGTARLGSEPVRAGDIAVLVRKSREGSAVREALMRRGVAAVSVGADTVLRSPEAAALLLLLRAVVHCRDRQALRAALASELLGFAYEDIAATVDDPDAWLQWSEQMRELNALWLQRGFMAMFNALLHRLSMAVRLATQKDPERRLTNVLHLGEMLQQTSRSQPGLESLLSWFGEQLEQSQEDETELRLESDEALVKIVTIHASKGLEYPIVFAPFLWSCSPRSRHLGDRYGIAFHDEAGHSCLAIDDDTREANLPAADRERLAEDVRLLYVALTRAKAHLTCVWGAADWRSYPQHTALAWLLHGEEGADTSSPSRVDPASASEALRHLASTSSGAIDVQTLPEPEALHWLEPDAEPPLLQARQFHGAVATDWRISSFSSLTRDVHQPAMARGRESSEDPILQFAAGSQVGLFLHDVLEHLDFQGDIESQAALLNEQFAKKYGFSAQAQQTVVTRWLRNIVETPLSEHGLCLARIAPGRRLNELAFDFAIDRLEIGQLNEVLNRWAGQALAPVSVEDFRGMITGVIDLVFEFEGRYYIADYKSNLLGMRLSDYAPEALRQAVFERRYDLQYLLYILALHRYLQQRLPHYHYDQHMGGAYYLFLRGLRPEHGPLYGVHFDLPPRTLIDTLDRQVFGLPAAKEETV